MPLDIQITTDWRGHPVPEVEHVRLRLHHDQDVLVVDVAAPFHGDPPPAAHPGPTWRLWEHEVVELFICGPDDHYVELELSPHGHHLCLRLQGVRNIVDRDVAVRFEAVRSKPPGAGERWTGRAALGTHLLPPGPHRINATAIHGLAPRRHLSWRPLAGGAPDFHQPAAFAPVDLHRMTLVTDAFRPT